MIEFATREYAEALVRKALCSCFVAIDGTITLRQEMVRDAANAVISCLASHGLLESSMDVRSVEGAVRAFVRSDGERAIPVSINAGVVARYICLAMNDLALAA